MTYFRHFWAFASALALGSTALAELPAPRLDRIYPLGLAAGGSVDVEVVGDALDGTLSLRFDWQGLTAEPMVGKPRWFKVTAATDVPPGTYDVRARGRFGVSGSRLLAVQQGLAEVQEVEPNDTIKQSQSIPVNTVVNGASDGENV